MSEIDYLREQRQVLWQRVKGSHTNLMRARKLTNSLEARYKEDEKAYESCDRRLAFLDGRFKVVVEADRHKTKVELSYSQLVEIAEKLGIDLSTGEITIEPEPEPLEVTTDEES